jgi:hypothetical protein
MSSIGENKADVFKDLEKYTLPDKDNLTIELSILKNKDLKTLSDSVKDNLYEKLDNICQVLGQNYLKEAIESTDSYVNVLYHGSIRSIRRFNPENVVMILIYSKPDCKNDTLGYNDNALVLKIRCVNTPLCKKINLSVGIFYNFGYTFFKHAKENGFRYIIQESATSVDHYTDYERESYKGDGGFKKPDKARYGKNTPLHLICNNSAMGFKEDPDIALKYDCFDKGYPYNSMVIDLDTIVPETGKPMTTPIKPSFCNSKPTQHPKNYKQYLGKIPGLDNERSSIFNKLDENIPVKAEMRTTRSRGGRCSDCGKPKKTT